MRLLVTRPEVDSRELRARLEAAGHVVTVEPMLEVEPVGEGALDLAGVQALVVTSRNALRALAGASRNRIAAALQLPLIAVGPGTAELARQSGFTDVSSGPAAARDLVEVVRATRDPAAGSVLHLAGETLAFDLVAALTEAGFQARKAVVYRAHPRRRLTPETERLLRQRRLDAVILMSPRTAAIYAGLMATHGLAGAVVEVAHLCLSAAVAARLVPLGSSVNVMEVAVQPNLEEMLALVARVAAQSRPKS